MYTCLLQVKLNDMARQLHLSRESNVEKEEEEGRDETNLPCPYSGLRTIAENGRALRRRSRVGVQKWRGKGAGGGEGVGGAGVRMKIDLLRR